jgi:hypothetical protein
VGNWDWNCDGDVEAHVSEYSVPNHQVCDDNGCYDPVAEPYRYCDYMIPYPACHQKETLYYFDDPGPLDQQCGKVRHELFCAFSFGEFICQPRDREHEQYWPTVLQDCR